METIKVLAGAI